MSLIYLLSSLPSLRMETTPGLTPAAFAAICEEQLSATDAQAARALACGGESEHPFVRLWRDRDAILRNAVARERARAMGQDATRWLHSVEGCDLHLEHAVETACQEKDPLLRERALDRIRWITAEELAGADPLSIRRVFAYAIQLEIVTRWQNRTTEKGRATFAALTEVPITL